MLAGWYLEEGDIILDFVLASVVLADLILIKKSRRLNCYSFLQKSLLKTKT